jgi:2-keto-4-pentenoate hydratase/2-oxohepta-3-ene-1,7-dioic acid hydratase in catechol pathway
MFYLCGEKYKIFRVKQNCYIKFTINVESRNNGNINSIIISFSQIIHLSNTSYLDIYR